VGAGGKIQALEGFWFSNAATVAGFYKLKVCVCVFMLKLLPPTWRQPEMASGLPVAGFNVTSPKDAIKPGGQTGKSLATPGIENSRQTQAIHQPLVRFSQRQKQNGI